MRNYTLNIRLAAVLVAPLLLACGQDNTGGGTTYAMVPNCGGGTSQVLSTDSTGQLVCKTLPSGAVSLPACTANNQALTADGSQPSCDNLNTVDATTQMLLDTLTNVENKIIDYGTQLNTLGSGPTSQAKYVGLSSVSVTGKITKAALVGIPAATALCTTDYGAGAHMCTVYEIYYSAAQLLNLDPMTDVAPGGWVYMQSWRHAATTIPAGSDPNAGLADNCAGYTYTYTGADTNLWEGTTFEWSQDLSSVRVPKFFANTLCNTSQPIACCR